MRKLSIAVAAAILAGGVIAFASIGSAATLNYSATLSGADEIPANASGYTGSATFTIDDVTNQICVTSTINTGVAADVLTANHIHMGAVGVNGPVQVNFSTNLNTCVVSTAPIVASMRANPSDFYYNIHTAGFPGGAVRGQLLLVPATTTTVAPTTTSTVPACDPSYTGLCLPFGLLDSQVNCSDGVGVIFVVTVPVTVVGPDHYSLDSDNDLLGCEANVIPVVAAVTFTG